MRQEKSFPWIPVTIFAAFGLMCFIVGFLASNISNKNALRLVQDRLFKCENKFLALSKNVIANTNRVVKISEGVSGVWNKAVLAKADFNARIEEFLDQEKDSIESLKLNNDLIEEQLIELKRSMKYGQDQYEAVVEMYGVYKKIYELGMPPIGTLEGFNSGRERLLLKFSESRSRLYDYMPQLVDMAKTEAGTGTAVSSAPASEKAKPSDQIKKVASDMTYRQVESLMGVPRDKKKDPSGREIWVYPSDKAGFRNCVYFGSGKVMQSKVLPFNSELD